LSVLICENVEKKFKIFRAVKGVSFRAEEGECFGLLGPNGAGKSTLISMIYGSMSRSAGMIQVMGLDPEKQGRQVRSQTGVVTQENNLDSAMSVIENMRMYSRYVGVPYDEREKRIAELLDFMLLSHKKNAVIESLSGGMKRRLVFVRALLSQPKLLILDEPTTGLDPAVRQLLWDKINELKKTGTTILLTTHYMDEAERLCDRLVIMDEGTVRSEGTPSQLIQQMGPAYVAGVEKSFGEKIKQQIQAPYTFYEDKMHSYIGGDSLQGLSEALTQMQLKPLFLRPSNLEDVFLKITGRELADND
jgi:lipooligosaccharide transport system ATP-binding protein